MADEWIARISFNKNGWRGPTVRTERSSDSDFVKSNSFGGEDWLFRDEWLIEGWRYAFLQGAYVKRNKPILTPINVDLWTIDSENHKRLYVARIEELECLTNEAAHDAVEAFKKSGWLEQMRNDIARVGGKPDQLAGGDATLNVRFKLANLFRFSKGLEVPHDDPIVAAWPHYNRYYLQPREISPQSRADEDHTFATRSSKEEIIPSAAYLRKILSTSILVTPEHEKMQLKLLEELRESHPDGIVSAETNFMDVSCRLGDELTIYEIKSEMKPLSVIRAAIGQLIEYAYRAQLSSQIKLERFSPRCSASVNSRNRKSEIYTTAP